MTTCPPCHGEPRGQARGARDLGTDLAAQIRGTSQDGAQFTNVPMSRAMLCAISLSSGNDSIPITEYPSSHGIR